MIFTFSLIDSSTQLRRVDYNVCKYFESTTIVRGSDFPSSFHSTVIKTLPSSTSFDAASILAAPIDRKAHFDLCEIHGKTLKVEFFAGAPNKNPDLYDGYPCSAERPASAHTTTLTLWDTLEGAGNVICALRFIRARCALLYETNV